MKKKMNSVLLVDDNDFCNEFHQIIINKMGITEKVEVATDGKEALAYLKSTVNGKHPKPDLIFLDINMPVMNGWEFLEEYKKLDAEMKANIIVIVTSSFNPDDKKRADLMDCVDGFKEKFLSLEKINEILMEHFPE